MMYVDDNIQNASKCIIPKLFAGDINVSVHKDIKLGYALANTELEPLYRWLEANKLSLSIVEDEDTTFTLFSQNNINMLKRYLHCIFQEWHRGLPIPRTYIQNMLALSTIYDISSNKNAIGNSISHMYLLTFTAVPKYTEFTRKIVQNTT